MKGRLRQATLIEPSFNQLVKDFSTDNLSNPDGTTGYDPESLRVSHCAYLNNLLEGLFLSSNDVVLSSLLKRLLQQVDAIVDIIREGDNIDQVRARGLKALVDECVRELEGVGERDGKGRVETLLLALDGGQWFTDNLHNDEGNNN